MTLDDPEQARRAIAIFDQLSVREPGFISTVVWAEKHWVLTRTVTAGDVVEQLAALSRADEIHPEDAPALAGAVTAVRRGADFADSLIACAAMCAGCGEVVTFDVRAARQLGWRLA